MTSGRSPSPLPPLNSLPLNPVFFQAAAAKDRPEAKRWIDQSIIDKAYKEREEGSRGRKETGVKGGP